jgi:hypothetical protein
MRREALAFFIVITMLLIPSNVVAHDPKNYTILLFEDGPTPDGVATGILVEKIGRASCRERVFVHV